jgi:hypothetical protein
MSHDRIEALSRSLADSTSRRGMLRLLGVGVAGSAITMVGLTEVEAARKKAKKRKVRAQKKAPLSPNPFIVPFTGTLADGITPVSGVLEVTKFINVGGQLTAVGNVLDAVTGAIIDTFTAVVTPGQRSCTILHLELGPITLNLLGLVITTNKIVINITAQSGPGNLLGNLLCAIAGLLDRGGAVDRLVGLLNQLLGLFR